MPVCACVHAKAQTLATPNAGGWEQGVCSLMSGGDTKPHGYFGRQFTNFC